MAAIKCTWKRSVGIRQAFITPLAVYEWKVLPMGVKVGPQVFQRLVQWVVRNCPFSDPYIDDVLTSTGHSCKYDPSAGCLIAMLWMISQHFCSLGFHRPLSFLMVLRTLICSQNFLSFSNTKLKRCGYEIRIPLRPLRP